MDDEDSAATVLSEWSFGFYDYTIVEDEVDRYVEVHGNIFGSEVFVSHAWSKWKLMALGYAVLGIFMTLMGIVSTFFFLVNKAWALWLVLVIYWAFCLFVLSAAVPLVYNTFTLPKHPESDYESPYR